MDLDKGTETLNKADGFLTKLKDILKKHWGILLIVLSCYGIYEFGKAVNEMEDEEVKTEIVEPKVADVEEKTTPKYTITKKTFFIDDYGYRKGDTILIDYYSDGFIDKYYIDGEDYLDK
jgi:hypothetical protein